MSSAYSSSSGVQETGPRYDYRVCKCGRKAALKIVDFEKPSKGRLYFICSAKYSQEASCDFFAWCHPIGSNEGTYSALGNQHPALIENEGTTKETNITRQYLIRKDSHVNIVEAANGLTYIVMVASVVLSMLSLLLHVLK